MFERHGLRVSRRGQTKKDHVNNEDIWREANIEPMTTFLGQRRLRWYGHVLTKEAPDTTKRMITTRIKVISTRTKMAQPTISK